METGLEQIRKNVSDNEDIANQSLEVVVMYLDEANTLTSNYRFPSINDEVHFYKYLKPKLITRYFYFYRLAQYEIEKHKLDVKNLQKYFRKEKKRILLFFEKMLIL